jgi:alpha-galactosidase
MEKDTEFLDQNHTSTVFARTEEAVWLAQLCGLGCGSNGANSGPERTRGLFNLDGQNPRFNSHDLTLAHFQAGGDSLKLEWIAGTIGLHWLSNWSLQPSTGIWSRQDRLFNDGSAPISIQRALLRFPFSPGQLDIYAQGSNWAHESQGTWIFLPTGELTLSSHAGRTNQGASPYVFLRSKGNAMGIAFHILPRGNWVIHIDRSCTVGNPSAPFTVLELGVADDRLKLELAPGAAFDLPEVLIQATTSDEPESGAPILHRYALERFFAATFPTKSPGVKPAAPVVYNTWFDAFEGLDVDRLRTQLAAAREIGCEVFVVDAGWYGNGIGPWDRQVGDWQEKQSAAFHGRMAGFAQEVRSNGLGFGLWMEPERFAPAAPILRTHPDWFLPCPYGYYYPDLSQPVIRDYLLSEISRLVEDYHLAWLKIDFNLEMGHAEDELAGYYAAWYGLLDEFRQRFPGTFMEGCASGGMRLELNTLAHFDGHFLSDTVNPVDMLRITQGILLRVPPGRLTRWAVMRPAGQLIPRHGLPPPQALEPVITPGGADWGGATMADLDFICRVALPGMLGFSGDLAGLSVKIRARLRHHVEFYRHWRGFLAGSICHLLTPIQGLNDRSGWVAFQMQQPQEKGASLVFVYRLEDGAACKRISLQGLDPERAYQVTTDDKPAGEPYGFFSGRELSSAGLLVELPSKFSAGVYIITP